LNLGRNSLNTSASATTDLRVLKYFPFGELKRLDVVAEFFNLFNSANGFTGYPLSSVRIGAISI